MILDMRFSFLKTLPQMFLCIINCLGGTDITSLQIAFQNLHQGLDSFRQDWLYTVYAIFTHPCDSLLGCLLFTKCSLHQEIRNRLQNDRSTYP